MWNCNYPSEFAEVATLDPLIRRKLENYAKCPQLLHTIFHGPYGSGKYTAACFLVAKHFGIPLNYLIKKKKHSYTEREREYWYQQSSFHFEIDVRFFHDMQQAVIIEIIMELSKTKNISNNRYQIIFLKNADYLEASIQHQLRKMMESFYKTCRLFFFTHNVACIDATIQSRCLLLTIPRPQETKVKSFLQEYGEMCKEDKKHSDVLCQKASSFSNGNLHLALQHLQTSVRETSIDLSESDILEKYTTQIHGILIDSTKNPCTLAASMRQYIRDILVTQLPIDELIIRLVHKFAKNRLKLVTLSKIVAAAAYCMYLHDLGYKREFYIELLFSTITLLLHEPNQSIPHKWL